MKKLIIEMMLDFAHDYDPRILKDLNQRNKIQVLNSMVYIAIYQKFTQSNIYNPKEICKYFDFDDYEQYCFNISCCWLNKFQVIDTEHEWILELLHTEKTDFHTITVYRDDIGSSTIEFFPQNETRETPSMAFTFNFKTKQVEENIKPKPTILAKPKNRNRIIKKKSNNLDFDR